MTKKIIRAIDIVLAIMGLLLLWPLMLLIYIVGFFDTGSPVFFQARLGRNKTAFTLLKFRTMHKSTSSVATHEVPAASITPLGSILRKTKLDELPQLINVLKGDMSLVGPRPCLPTQIELIAARDALGVFDAVPGITGLAQINGIDMSVPVRLAEWDQRMIRDLSIATYFEQIFLTMLGHGSGDRVKR